MSTLFTHVTALLMDDDFSTLKDGFVAVEGTDISYVGTVRPEGSFDEVIDCAGKVMMPGFVNTHTHIPMTLMRGYGGGHSLHDWLHNYIFPAEARLDDRSVAAGTGLGLMEMIASGVTCIADMYSRTGIIAEELVKAGISANLSCGGVYFGDPAAFSENTCSDCRNQLALTEQWHGFNGGQILVDASIHAEYTSCPPLWQWMADHARSHGLRMHVHISETASEHRECLARYDRTPIALLDGYGVWDNGGIAAHCVYTTGEDWDIMTARGITAVHNPYSNLKLGSGVAPIDAMLAAGVNVALGTDGMSSHNSCDMFQDMKLAALLPCGIGGDPTAMTARSVLEAATCRGARALGRRTGSIIPGYAADLILVDFEAPNLFPCHDIAENLVYSANGSNVVMNMARGKVIYRNGAFYTLDADRIRSEVRDYALPLIFG